MQRLFRKLSLVFSAGCVGGLVNSLVVWLFGERGITAALGVGIAPALTWPWLYKRIVWGGLWGALFIFPLLRKSIIGRGLLYSLGPTLVQLLVVYPLNEQRGLLGLDLGNMTPLFVLLFNALWGITAAVWLELAGDKPPQEKQLKT